mgnify:CR=1 FL=1
MSVTSVDVAQVALLARLDILDTDIDSVAERFSRILKMVDALKTVETDGVEPMSNPHDMIQRLRADAVTETDQRAVLQAVAPSVEDGYFLVPRVID